MFNSKTTTRRLPDFFDFCATDLQPSLFAALSECNRVGVVPTRVDLGLKEKGTRFLSENVEGQVNDLHPE